MKSAFRLLSAFGLVAFGVVSALGTDGDWIRIDKSYDWSLANGAWRDDRPASDGGLVYFDFPGSCAEQNALNQDIEGLTLGGFVEKAGGWNYNAYLKGKDIQLTGDAVFAYGNGSPKGAFYVQGNDFTGTADDTVTFTNARYGLWGDFYLQDSVFSGFGLLNFGVGTVFATGNAETAITTGSTRFTNGRLEVAPSGTAGDVALSLSTASGATVTAGEGSGELVVGKGSATSVTLTTGPVVREGTGVLSVAAKSGLAALGSTERIKPASVGGVTSGLLPAWFVGWDESAASKPFTFLSLGADGALEPAAYTDGLGGGAASVAKLTAAATVSDDTAVKGLRLDGDGSTTVTIAFGKKLTVGDGTNPAGVIINYGDKAAASPVYQPFTGGTVDFGTSEGIVWASPTTKATGWSWGSFIDIYSDITGANGVTFAGRLRGPSPSIRLYGAASWTGDTHVYGARFVPAYLASIPSGSTIYIHGSGRWGSSQFYLQAGRSGTPWTIPNDIHLAGIGTGSYGNFGSYEGAILQQNGATVFSGTITLDDYASVNSYQDNITFNGKITGPGGLALLRESSVANKVVFALNAANDYAGPTDLARADVTLGENGTFGRGLVTIPSEVTVTVNVPAAGKTLDSPFVSEGRFVVSGNAVTLPKKAEFASVEAQSPTAFKVKDLTVDDPSGLLSADTEAGTITAYDAASTLTVGSNGADANLRLLLGDGDGKLSFVKRGSNAVTLYGEQKISGSVTVEGGTLRLGPQADYAELPYLLDASVWLDASKGETLQCQADGVTVTNWVSALGDGLAFGPAGQMFGRATDFGFPVKRQSAAWGDEERQVLYFNADEFDRLSANLARRYKHVFLAVRVTQVRQTGSMLGKTKEDESYFQLSASADAEVQKTTMQPGAFGSPKINGQTTSTYTFEAPTILSVASTAADPDMLVSIAGSRNNNSGDWAYRPVGGEYAELIAFNRTLTDDERKVVEDYLSLKWTGKTIHGTEQAGFATKFADTTVLTMADGAVLDLNGNSQTLASLEGLGEIINSSDTPATLKVTSSSSFKGKVGAGVTLEFAAGGAPALTVDAQGAIRCGAETTLDVYNLPLPTTDGLCYWLDAADTDSLQFAADGVSVTNWSGKAPSAVTFRQEGDLNKFAAPFYEAEGVNGKPALLFGESGTNNVSRLIASETCVAETIFLVFKPKGGGLTGSTDHGLWVPNGEDNGSTCAGVKMYYQDQSQIQFYENNYFGSGDTFRLGGEPMVLSANGAYNCGEPSRFYCLTVRRDGTHDAYTAARNALGLYRADMVRSYTSDNRSFHGWICEVLAYGRKLTDAEVETVEGYLMRKWSTTDPMPVVNTSVFANGGSLVFDADASGELGAVTLGGDVNLSLLNLSFGDLSGLANGKHAFFTVTGKATGEPVITPPRRKWLVERAGNVWSLVNKGLMLLFR